MKIASPQPALCSVCYGAHPDRRFIDFEVVHDGTPVIDPDTGAIAHLPTGQQTLDDLFICEVCMKTATELLGLEPELHGRQRVEIDRQQAKISVLQGMVHRQQAQISEMLEAGFDPPLPKRRKVPA